MLEQVRQDGRRERWRGRRHVGVYAHESEQHGRDVGARRGRAGFLGWGGLPRGRRDARFDEGADFVGDGPYVQVKEAGIALREGVVDVLDFAGKFDRKLGFELGNEIGEDGSAESFEVAKGEQHAEILLEVSWVGEAEDGQSYFAACIYYVSACVG